MLTEIVITDGDKTISFPQSALNEIMDGVYLLNAYLDAKNIEVITFSGKDPTKIENVFINGKTELTNLTPRTKRLITLTKKEYIEFARAYKNLIKIKKVLQNSNTTRSQTLCG